MKEYKQPETRIKVVTQGSDVKYYPQYKQVIIPNFWWEWHPCLNDIANHEFTRDIENAKERVDIWIIRDRLYHYENLEKDRIKNSKEEIIYIKYP